MSFHTRKSFVHLRNIIYDENREACDCPIDCQVILIVKVQKSMKSIVRVVHLPAVVQSEFYNATKIIFVRKENKNNDFFQKCVPSLSLRVTVAPFWRLSTERKHLTLFCIRRAARMRCFRSNQSVNTGRICILVLRLIQKSVRILRSVDNL